MSNDVLYVLFDASSVGLFHERSSLLNIFLYFNSHKKNRSHFFKLSTNIDLFVIKRI